MTNKPQKAQPWAESLLVAYVDGELEPVQAAAVEATLREDAEARAIVSVLRRSAAAVKFAFDRPLHEPVPAKLLAAVQAEAPAMPMRSVARLRRPASGARRVLLALAASILVLAIGFGAGYLQFGRAVAPLRPAGNAAGDAAAARHEAALYQALETAADGEALRYGAAASGLRGSIAILGPVALQSGDRCREFRQETSGPAGDAVSHGIACRSAGGWSVLTLPSPGIVPPSEG